MWYQPGKRATPRTDTMKRYPLSILIVLSLLNLPACDAAVIGECAIIPVGAQVNVGDDDLDGQADHRAFVVAELKGDCTGDNLSAAHVSMFETSPGTNLHGYATPTMLGPDCVMWTWPDSMHLSEWAVLITPPAKGQVVTVYSGAMATLPPGATLPVWRDGIGEEWTARLPAGLPTSCTY